MDKRRVREFADLAAIMFAQRYGITKSANGRPIAEQFMPYAESAVKKIERQEKLISAQRQLIDGQKRLIENQDKMLAYSKQLYDRMAATRNSTAAIPVIEHFQPNEWSVQRLTDNVVQRGMTKMNGHNHNLPESNGHIPHEP